MRIPKTDTVQFIIKEVLQERKVTSQKELADLVNRKLKKVDTAYSISERRARSAALQIAQVKVSTLTKKGQPPKKCPSCGHSLKRIYTKNLKGKKLLVRLVCAKCSYTGKENKWEPQRYSFELKR